MSNKTQLAANNTQLASLIQTLQGKAAGGGSSGGATLVSGDLAITSSTYEPGVDEITLTSDALATSSRQIIVILYIADESSGYLVVTALHRPTLSDDWTGAMGNSVIGLSSTSIVVNENSISGYGSSGTGSYSFVAM